MDSDYLAAFRTIETLLTSREPVSAKMHSLIAACDAKYPHGNWATLRDLPYDDEAQRLGVWLPDVLHNEPPTTPLAGLWFGLFNPVLNDGSPSADVHLSGSATFDPHDETFGWAAQGDYTPAAADANSDVLAKLVAVAYASEDALGNVAEYPLGLGYAAFVVAQVLRSIEAIPSSVSNAGIAVGFDSGDGLLIGRFTPNVVFVDVAAAA